MVSEDNPVERLSIYVKSIPSLYMITLYIVTVA